MRFVNSKEIYPHFKQQITNNAYLCAQNRNTMDFSLIKLLPVSSTYNHFPFLMPIPSFTSLTRSHLFTRANLIILYIGFFAIFTIFSLHGTPAIANPIFSDSISDCPKRELRAVWLTTLNGLDWPKTRATNSYARRQQQQELCNILDQLKALNINTILLQTRIRGSVIYPSSIEPWDVAITGSYGNGPGYDPLYFAIEEAHRRGMELHAWVVTIPCFKQAIGKRMGAKSVLRTHPELCRKHGDMYYLDPGMPGTADYLVSICHEIVSRYDIDGLHFDYIRYPEGASSFSDASTFRKYAPIGQTKASWRRDNITRIVRRIYEDTHRLKPWVKVSCSPVGKYADVTRYSSRGWNARDAVHQDAQGWLRDGIHDILFPMMYFDGNHFYPFAADWQEQSCERMIVPGLGIYFLHPKEKNWDLSVIQRQLHYLREQGLAGQCYFRSKFLTDNVKGLYDYLRDDYYAFPALPPACPWLDSVPPTAPTDITISILSDQTEELSWTPSTDNLEGGVRYNVYTSQHWPVDITCSRNLVATQLSEPHFSYNRVAAFGRYFAITAIDRVGNESEATQVTEEQDNRPSSSQKKLHIDAHGHIHGLVVRPEPMPELKLAKKKKKRK